MTESVFYVHLTPAEFRERLARAPIAYLPLGTLEWHGEHLPLGSDGLQSAGFFARLAEEVGGIVLPMLFLGPDRLQQGEGKVFYGMDILGYAPDQPRQLDGSAYWVDAPLFDQLLEAILFQLARAGFKIVVAHGHGPSTGRFRDHSAAWEGQFGLKLFHCWGEIQAGVGIPEAEKSDYGIQTDHAAANETSLMMALHPEMVHMEALPADMQTWPLAILGNDPRRFASPEKGERAIRMQSARMAELLRAELARL